MLFFSKSHKGSYGFSARRGLTVASLVFLLYRLLRYLLFHFTLLYTRATRGGCVQNCSRRCVDHKSVTRSISAALYLIGLRIEAGPYPS